MTSPLYLRAGILRQVKLAYQILKWKNNVFVQPILETAFRLSSTLLFAHIL